MIPTQFMRIHAGRVDGQAAAPPSKSVTHRAFLLAAQSSAPAVVASPLDSADTRATLHCLLAMGARFAPVAGGIRFEPAALRPATAPLDCGNSGTTMRLLAATAARLHAPVTLTGDASLRRRPNAPLLDALHGLGAQVRSDNGRAPLTLQGPIHPGMARLPPLGSSQFASALMLSLPMLDGPSEILLEAPIASRPYLDVTLDIAARAGLRLRPEPGKTGHQRIHVAGGQVPDLGAFRVEGDWSAAAFLFAGAALTAGDVTVTGLDPATRQGDRAILDHLRSFGALVSATPRAVRVQGPDRPTSPGTIDVTDTPDLFPVLAVLAAASRGTTTFAGGSQLRAKESDRIQAVAAGLGRMGIRCEALPDGMRVQGGTLQGGAIDAAGDHRIHMAFMVAGLAAEGHTVVDGPGSAAVSFPGFHDALRALGAKVEPLAEVAP